MIDILSVSPEQGPAAQALNGLRRIVYRSGVDGAEDYALAGHKVDASLWVVMPHGHGSHGDQLFVRDYLRPWLETFLAHDVGILTPNLRDNAWASPDAVADLHDLLAFARDAHGVEKFVFFSGSMGGTTNLVYAVIHPTDVAGLSALGAATDMPAYVRWCLNETHAVGTPTSIGKAIIKAYGGTPEDKPALYSRHSTLQNAGTLTMPVYTAHGSDDAFMPVEQVRQLAEQMGSARHFVYREIRGGAHDSPLELVDSFRWLLDRI